MKKIILTFATGFGSGYIPWASGTWGSAVGLILYYFLFRNLSFVPYLLTLTAWFALSIWSAGEAEKYFGKDSGKIVIDEIVGIFFSLALIPLSWKTGLAAFLLFRLFDIWKPFPARWCQDHLPGGWGVVMDDVVAGIYANLILQVFKRFAIF